MKYVQEGTRDVLGLDPKEVDISKLIEILDPEEQLILAKKEAASPLQINLEELNARVLITSFSG